MTPINYCYEKIAAHGSPLYYCVKKISTSSRDAVVAVMAFYDEIMGIILNGTDLHVSYSQLNWWRSEIVKSVTNNYSDHPIIMALNNTHVNPKALLDIIDGLEQNLNLPPFDTFETQVIHIMRTAGVRELLIAEIATEKIPAEIMYQFTIVLELVNYIQNIRCYLRRQLLFFPQDEMSKFNVSAELLYGFKTTPDIVNLLQFQAEKIERAYQKACASLTPTMTKQLSYLLARCDIARATLSEIQASGFTVLEHYIQLTPLRMWWLAYRSG
jgi:15-cis-phytoene synthase